MCFPVHRLCAYVWFQCTCRIVFHVKSVACAPECCLLCEKQNECVLSRWGYGEGHTPPLQRFAGKEDKGKVLSFFLSLDPLYSSKLVHVHLVYYFIFLYTPSLVSLPYQPLFLYLSFSLNSFFVLSCFNLRF